MIQTQNICISLNKTQNAVGSQANAKEEGAEDKVDLEHAVGRLGVHWTASSMLFLQNFLALDVVGGDRGVMEETLGGLKSSLKAGAG